MKFLFFDKRSALSASIICAALSVAASHSASAQVTTIAPGVLQYGDADLEGFQYPMGANPMAGSTLIGLSPGTLTLSNSAYGHGFPFSPSPTDYAGTDQIYVGSNQTGSDDGYSQYAGRIAGPQIVTLDYSSLIAPGQVLTGLTLGLAADDFQFQAFGNPFTATINGATNSAITTQLNALNQTGPYEQFFSVGIDPTTLLPNNTLTLTINEGGNGGDGWALDFLTVGVTTSAGSAAAAPEPNSATLGMLGSAAFGGLAAFVRRRRTVSQ